YGLSPAPPDYRRSPEELGGRTVSGFARGWGDVVHWIGDTPRALGRFLGDLGGAPSVRSTSWACTRDAWTRCDGGDQVGRFPALRLCPDPLRPNRGGGWTSATALHNAEDCQDSDLGVHSRAIGSRLRHPILGCAVGPACSSHTVGLQGGCRTFGTLIRMFHCDPHNLLALLPGKSALEYQEEQFRWPSSKNACNVSKRSCRNWKKVMYRSRSHSRFSRRACSCPIPVVKNLRRRKAK